MVCGGTALATFPGKKTLLPLQVVCLLPRGVFFIYTDFCLLFLTCGSLSWALAFRKAPSFSQSFSLGQARERVHGTVSPWASWRWALPWPALLGPGRMSSVPYLLLFMFKYEGRLQPWALWIQAPINFSTSGRKGGSFVPLHILFLNPWNESFPWWTGSV